MTDSGGCWSLVPAGWQARQGSQLGYQREARHQQPDTQPTQCAEEKEAGGSERVRICHASMQGITSSPIYLRREQCTASVN